MVTQTDFERYLLYAFEILLCIETPVVAGLWVVKNKMQRDIQDNGKSIESLRITRVNWVVHFYVAKFVDSGQDDKLTSDEKSNIHSIFEEAKRLHAYAYRLEYNDVKETTKRYDDTRNDLLSSTRSGFLIQVFRSLNIHQEIRVIALRLFRKWINENKLYHQPAQT